MAFLEKNCQLLCCLILVSGGKKYFFLHIKTMVDQGICAIYPEKKTVWNQELCWLKKCYPGTAQSAPETSCPFCWFALFHKTTDLLKDFKPYWFKSCSFRQTVVTFCQMQSGHSQSYYKFLRFTGMYFLKRFRVSCRLLWITLEILLETVVHNLSLIFMGIPV